MFRVLSYPGRVLWGAVATGDGYTMLAVAAESGRQSDYARTEADIVVFVRRTGRRWPAKLSSMLLMGGGRLLAATKTGICRPSPKSYFARKEGPNSTGGWFRLARCRGRADVLMQELR